MSEEVVMLGQCQVVFFHDRRIRSVYCPVLVGDEVPLASGKPGRVTAVRYERDEWGFPTSVRLTAVPEELADEGWLAECYAGEHQGDDSFPPGDWITPSPRG